MAFEKVKRNQYFDPPTEFPHSSRNHAEDMEDFHLPMDRMHHAHLHDRGIARGLEVSGTIGGTEVVVNAGVAIDGEGRLIVLASTGNGDIGANPRVGDNEEVEVPVSLTTSTHADQTVYVTIQFSEILRIAEGSGGRREQVPWLRLQPVAGSEAFVDDGTSIILAIVVTDADGNLAELKSQDGALPFRRRLIGETTAELRIRRGDKVGDRVQEVVACKIGPKVGGGLEVTVPNIGDGVSIAKEGSGNFANFELRANTVAVKDGAGNDALKFDANSAVLSAGTSGKAGKLSARNEADQETIGLDGSSGRLTVGTDGQGGSLMVTDAAGQEAMRMDGATAALSIGAAGRKGDLAVRNSDGESTFTVDGDDGDMVVHRKIDAADREGLRFDAAQAALHLGTADRGGDLVVKDSQDREAVKIAGGGATLSIGATGNDGQLVLRDSAGRNTMVLNGESATLNVGISGNEGDLIVRDAGGAITGRIDGNTGMLKIKRIDPYGDSLHVDAKYLRIHGWDLMLDGRSGRNNRALVDYNDLLVINHNSDYGKGVLINKLQLSHHIKGVVWESHSDIRKPRDVWIKFYEVDTRLKTAEWEFVSMCEVGMRDKGTVKNFYWETDYAPYTKTNGNRVIRWMVRYRDNGTDWYPTQQAVFWLAFRK